MASKTPASWFDGNGLAYSILAVTVLVELTFFMDYHDRRWNEVVLPRTPSEEAAGEGLVIQCNGLGYYAWLRSPLIDGDWDFDNEFDEHNPLHNYVPPRTYRTPIDRRANQWSVGPACAWAV